MLQTKVDAITASTEEENDPQDIGNCVPLIVSCPTCGYEQAVELIYIENKHCSPGFQLFLKLIDTPDKDDYRFFSKSFCSNCKKEITVSLMVTSRDSEE